MLLDFTAKLYRIIQIFYFCWWLHLLLRKSFVKKCYHIQITWKFWSLKILNFLKINFFIISWKFKNYFERKLLVNWVLSINSIKLYLYTLNVIWVIKFFTAILCFQFTLAYVNYCNMNMYFIVFLFVLIQITLCEYNVCKTWYQEIE